ncbi:MAG: P-loop NTPase fold protein [Candidatus Bathyarchaeota archaeon]
MNSQNELELIHGDTHITKFSQDWFGFSSHAKKLVNEISVIAIDSCICCGVIGEWGTGKSSFMKLMSNYIHDDFDSNNLVIWYIAWDPYGLSNMGDAILFHIFKTVANYSDQNPSEYSETIKKEFIKFQEALGIRKGLRSSVQKIFKTLSASETAPGLLKDVATIGEKTISEMQSATVIRSTLETLNEYLNNKNIFLYLFIDELDRSTGDQIFSIFSELKAYLSHNRIAIILGYSESYVIEAIKNELPEEIDANQFIDKIITLRKNIPLPDLTSLKNIAYKYLQKYPIISDYLDELSEYAANLCDWNPRRLKRILLSFIQHLPAKDIGENNFICLLIMTALDESGLLKYREFNSAIINNDIDVLLSNLKSLSDSKLEDEAKCICEAIEKLNLTSRFSTVSVQNLGLPIFKSTIIKKMVTEYDQSKKYNWKPQIFKIFSVLKKQGLVISSDFFVGDDELCIKNAENTEIKKDIIRQISIFRSDITYYTTSDYDLYILFTEQITRIVAEIYSFISKIPYIVKKMPVILWIIDDGDCIKQIDIEDIRQTLNDINKGLKNPVKIIYTNYDQIDSLIDYLFTHF